MLIVSKFHDFYDHVQQAGVDKNVVLHRERKEYEIPKGLKFHNSRLACIDSRGERVAAYNFVSGRIFLLEWIFFCGKAYPKILSYDKIYHDETRYNIKYYDSIEEAEKDIPQKSHYFNGKNWSTGKTAFQEVREDLAVNRDIDSEIFRKVNAPYFVISVSHDMVNRKVITYPMLKDYTNYLNLDAYSTYQEIEMYCSGVLGVGEPNTIEVSDISKRDSKGFDKYSFKHRK